MARSQAANSVAEAVDRLARRPGPQLNSPAHRARERTASRPTGSPGYFRRHEYHPLSMRRRSTNAPPNIRVYGILYYTIWHRYAAPVTPTPPCRPSRTPRHNASWQAYRRRRQRAAAAAAAASFCQKSRRGSSRSFSQRPDGLDVATTLHL